MTENKKTEVLGEILTLIGLSSLGVGLFLCAGLGVMLTTLGIVVTFLGVSALVRGGK